MDGGEHAEERAIGTTPWHLWVIGILTLIWNAFGAWDYTQTQLQNRDYLAAMMEPMGIPVAEGITYYEAFPAWADAAWALGVWGALAGSLLLLLRSKWSILAFTISLFGLVVTTLYTIGAPLEGASDTPMGIAFTVVIWIVTIALILYCRKMAMKNVLR